MGPGEAIRTVFGKYAQLDGRASRSEYWWWALFLLAIQIVISVVATALGNGASTVDGLLAGAGLISLVSVLIGLVLFLPSLGVFVRRLHDVGRSGWWFWIAIIPFGVFVLLVFLLLDSEPGPNRWGPPPRGSRYADPTAWRFYQGAAPAQPAPMAWTPAAPPAPQPPVAPAAPPASWQSAPQQPQPPQSWQSAPQQPEAPQSWQSAPQQPQAPQSWQSAPQQPQPPAQGGWQSAPQQPQPPQDPRGPQA